MQEVPVLINSRRLSGPAGVEIEGILGSNNDLITLDREETIFLKPLQIEKKEENAAQSIVSIDMASTFIGNSYQYTTVSYLHLFRFPDTAVRMNICDVYRSVSFITPNASSDPHAKRLSGVLSDIDDLLGQLRTLYPESFLQELSHLRVGIIGLRQSFRYGLPVLGLAPGLGPRPPLVPGDLRLCLAVRRHGVRVDVEGLQ